MEKAYTPVTIPYDIESFDKIATNFIKRFSLQQARENFFHYTSFEGVCSIAVSEYKGKPYFAMSTFKDENICRDYMGVLLMPSGEWGYNCSHVSFLLHNSVEDIYKIIQGKTEEEW